ncbi:unnamed protein product [Chrysoparadoxa australica]
MAEFRAIENADDVKMVAVGPPSSTVATVTIDLTKEHADFDPALYEATFFSCEPSSGAAVPLGSAYYQVNLIGPVVVRSPTPEPTPAPTPPDETQTEKKDLQIGFLVGDGLTGSAKIQSVTVVDAPKLDGEGVQTATVDVAPGVSETSYKLLLEGSSVSNPGCTADTTVMAEFRPIENGDCVKRVTVGPPKSTVATVTIDLTKEHADFDPALYEAIILSCEPSVGAAVPLGSSYYVVNLIGPLATPPAPTPPIGPVVLPPGRVYGGTLSSLSSFNLSGTMDLIREVAIENGEVKYNYFLSFQNVGVSPGPDVHLYLTTYTNPKNIDYADIVYLDNNLPHERGLFTKQGNFQQQLWDDFDYTKYKAAVVWCRAFDVVWGNIVAFEA